MTCWWQIVCHEQGQIQRGERYTLLRNNGNKWDVKDAAGRKITAPAVCFMIPPTDPEAVGGSDKWVCANIWRICDFLKSFTVSTPTFYSSADCMTRCYVLWFQPGQSAEGHETENDKQQVSSAETLWWAEEGEWNRHGYRWAAHTVLPACCLLIPCQYFRKDQRKQPVWYQHRPLTLCRAGGHLCVIWVVRSKFRCKHRGCMWVPSVYWLKITIHACFFAYRAVKLLITSHDWRSRFIPHPLVANVLKKSWWSTLNHLDSFLCDKIYLNNCFLWVDLKNPKLT